MLQKSIAPCNSCLRPCLFPHSTSVAVCSNNTRDQMICGNVRSVSTSTVLPWVSWHVAEAFVAKLGCTAVPPTTAARSDNWGTPCFYSGRLVRTPFWQCHSLGCRPDVMPKLPQQPCSDAIIILWARYQVFALPMQSTLVPTQTTAQVQSKPVFGMWP